MSARTRTAALSVATLFALTACGSSDSEIDFTEGPPPTEAAQVEEATPEPEPTPEGMDAATTTATLESTWASQDAETRSGFCVEWLADPEGSATEVVAQTQMDRATLDSWVNAACTALQASQGTVSQQQAYKAASDHLEYSAFSRTGLFDQLTSEYGGQFPPEDAEFAIARLEAEGAVDWNAEAIEAAKQHLEYGSFSRQGLLDQLTSEYGGQFTPEQAEQAVATTGL